MAIQKGITCNFDTGIIYGVKGSIIERKHQHGYILIAFKHNNKSYNILGHQFVWYCKYNEIVEVIDHKNGDRTDNRIDNLRSGTQSLNHQNRKGVKGYIKRGNKNISKIKLNKKEIYLGSFETEEEARLAYVEAKKNNHIWNETIV